MHIWLREETECEKHVCAYMYVHVCTREYACVYVCS